ncbi:Retrovirus-related Pol polyprotein from transposon RE2 [Senna tora]|uniref:Retrovirus-related Pol polyprotein from transposon RE2 n=1 Tax=Senna tora TaxID=362788 RepID=A0A835CJQ5_9FABA|nr:Retrovirus-related Pol polyprotein from transposon RE2 [Senna tora]
MIIATLKIDSSIAMANLNGEDNHEQSLSKMKEDYSWVVHSSNKLGMVLVTSPLMQSNYLTWSTAMKTSLESKEKLGFIDESLPTPSQSNVVAYRRWKNADSFTALWKELETPYGLSCGPQIYQTQRLINTIQKDALRSQILAMEPRPSASKAFSKVAQMETEKEVKMNLGSVVTDASTLLAKQEIAKLSKGKIGASELASFAHVLDFAGNASNLQTLMIFGTWITDTGASSHMCHDRSLFSYLRVLTSPITMHLPDGKSVVVKEVGRAAINEDLVLGNV